MMRFLMVCLGGAVGTGARYLMGTWAVRAWGPRFPFGTLAINAIGSFLLVVIGTLAMHQRFISPDARIVLGTGIMGGFTTYSTFNYEVLRFFQEGAFAAGFVYLLATVAGCLVAGVLGLAVARALI